MTEVDQLKEQYLKLLEKYKDFKVQDCKDHSTLEEYAIDREIMKAIAKRLDEIDPRV